MNALLGRYTGTMSRKNEPQLYVTELEGVLVGDYVAVRSAQGGYFISEVIKVLPPAAATNALIDGREVLVAFQRVDPTGALSVLERLQCAVTLQQDLDKRLARLAYQSRFKQLMAEDESSVELVKELISLGVLDPGILPKQEIKDAE